MPSSWTNAMLVRSSCSGLPPMNPPPWIQNRAGIGAVAAAGA
jgi:hypothetical protein